MDRGRRRPRGSGFRAVGLGAGGQFRVRYPAADQRAPIENARPDRPDSGSNPRSRPAEAAAQPAFERRRYALQPDRTYLAARGRGGGPAGGSYCGTAELARAVEPRLAFSLIGQEHRGQEEYGRTALARAAAAGVDLVLGRPPEEVARHLAGSLVAYLPFPLGAAENRATLLACLENGCVPVTTRGKFTPPELDAAVVYAGDAQAALAAFGRLRSDGAAVARLRAAGASYLRRHSWAEVALGYLRVYTVAGRRGVKPGAGGR